MDLYSEYKTDTLRSYTEFFGNLDGVGVGRRNKARSSAGRRQGATV